MKAVLFVLYLGRNICYFNKIFNRVHQLEFSVCFEMSECLYPKLLSAPLMSQEGFNIETFK